MEPVATPDTRNSIVVKKQTTYRGASKVWSNRYHFDGDLPPDPGHWDTFMDNVVTAEKAMTNVLTTIIQVVGYDSSTASSSNPHGDAVYSKDYTTVGTMTVGGSDIGCPGDCASLVRYSTPERSSKNHPVYLMNYYHNAYNTATDGDILAADVKAAVEAYADDWIAGFSDGAETHVRCGPTGALATSRRVDQYVRHRDFPT